MIDGVSLLLSAVLSASLPGTVVSRVAADLGDTRGGFTLGEALAALHEGHPMRDYTTARAAGAKAATIAAGQWDNPLVHADYFLGIRMSSYDRAGTGVFTIQQLLPVTSVPRARTEVARREAEAVSADNLRLMRALELDVEVAMIRLARALMEVEIRREAFVDLENSRKVVETQVAAGVERQYDAIRIALSTAAVESSMRNAQAAVTEARGELAVAIGPLADRLRGAPQIDLFTHPSLPSLEELRRRMLDDRPDLAAARVRVDVARANVRLQRRSVFPGIGLRLATGFGQGPGQVDLGGGLTIPLPVVSRGQGVVDRARAEVRAADALTRTLSLAAEQRLVAAHAAAQQRRDASQRYLEMSREAAVSLRREAEDGYRNGRMTVLELADASLIIRDAKLQDLELATLARLAEIQLRRIVEVGVD